jgi:hypothetical protein
MRIKKNPCAPKKPQKRQKAPKSPTRPKNPSNPRLSVALFGAFAITTQSPVCPVFHPPSPQNTAVFLIMAFVVINQLLSHHNPFTVVRTLSPDSSPPHPQNMAVLLI